MTLICVRAVNSEYSRKNVAAVLPELLVLMAVRANDDSHQPPLSTGKIARLTGIPRQSVNRHLTQLETAGIVRRTTEGVVSADDYLERVIDAPYFKRMVRAIVRAGRHLEALSTGAR